jgi:predicted RNA-binding protein with PUA-like domain
MAKRQYWLMKSEPSVYSIGDLERDGTTMWEGVRNYQARNFMRDTMQVGDLVLFYHSSAKPMGVSGIGRIASASYPDPTQFDERSTYFDPDSPKDDPRWYLVDVQWLETLRRVVTLAEMKADDALGGMMVIQRGSRLSVQPVVRKHFAKVLRMAKAGTKP